MLKEVMLGSGGIMLAAAIFASSFSPGANPVPTAPEVAPPVAIAPVVAPPQTTTPRPAPIFPEDSGDMTFGAPMIETTPVESGTGEDAPMSAAPDTAEATGGRQFNAKPGRVYPVPR